MELTGNQTTQTQSLHSEQPKRKYVKVNNDEAAKRMWFAAVAVAVLY